MQSETIQYHLQTENSKRTKIGETARADISTNKITKEKKRQTHTHTNVLAAIFNPQPAPFIHPGFKYATNINSLS